MYHFSYIFEFNIDLADAF